MISSVYIVIETSQYLTHCPKDFQLLETYGKRGSREV